jgi:hypothetical protein
MKNINPEIIWEKEKWFDFTNVVKPEIIEIPDYSYWQSQNTLDYNVSLRNKPNPVQTNYTWTSLRFIDFNYTNSSSKSILVSATVNCYVSRPNWVAYVVAVWAWTTTYTWKVWILNWLVWIQTSFQISFIVPALTNYKILKTVTNWTCALWGWYETIL